MNPRKRFIAWLGTLRFPVLVSILAVLFLLDLVIPDAIPLVDEALLALVTVVLSRFKRRKRPSDD